MRRLALILAVTALGAGCFAVAAGADDARTYRIEMYNAFGIVEGSEVRVAGVNAGTVQDLTVNEDKRAEVTVELSTDLAELGTETECRAEPQSLIAEYFIDCDPAGAPLEEGGLIPASRVSQTVQPDLVQNTMREPYKLRLRLLINEFGTGLAGNADALNEAIRLGAPALTELARVTDILSSQAELIRDLNADSDRVIGELARRREALTHFVDEAEDAGRASAERREDLSHNFGRLDDFLAEFRPALVEMQDAADEQTPLLRDLRAAAPDLNRLAIGMQPFNRALEGSLRTLGEAGQVGERAMRRGGDEIELLARSGRNAPVTAEMLADLLRDLDDPRRAVEIDDRVAAATGRTGTRPGTRNTMGYTGLEGLLNYPYYQSLALNQFDQLSHILHFGLYETNTGACGSFSSGRDPETGEPGVPKQGGGTTTNILETAECVGWLGPNQPGVTEDLGLPKYHPSVCPEGTSPEAARVELCDPSEGSSRARRPSRGRGGTVATGTASDGSGSETPPTEPQPSGLPGEPGEVREQLEDLLDLPNDLLDGVGGGGLGGKKGGGAGAGVNQAAEDLLDFLFTP